MNLNRYMCPKCGKIIELIEHKNEKEENPPELMCCHDQKLILIQSIKISEE